MSASANIPVVKIRGEVLPDRTLVAEVPEDFPVGPVEIESSSDSTRRENPVHAALRRLQEDPLSPEELARVRLARELLERDRAEPDDRSGFPAAS